MSDATTAAVGKAHRTSDGTSPENNNTNPQPAPSLPTAEWTAAQVGVAPCNSSASRRQRRRASFWFHKLLTLSQWFDWPHLAVPNSCVNYQCMYWKALSGNDRASPVFDHGLAYDLLPPVIRLIAAPALVRWYPRFHHANVELRTAYIDGALKKILEAVIHTDNNNNNNEKGDQENWITKVRLISMGGGYDLRSIRIAEKFNQLLLNCSNSGHSNNHHAIDLELIEMDLPEVVAAKQLLLQKRLMKRRPYLTHLILKVRNIAGDLNKLDQVRDLLLQLVNASSSGADEDRPRTATCVNIFVFEAVLIYLQQGVPSELLRVIQKTIHHCNNQRSAAMTESVATTAITTVSITNSTAKPTHIGNLSNQRQEGILIFADTLEHVPQGLDDTIARQTLHTLGWTLQGWCPKPGRTQHMGWATTASSTRSP